MYKTLKQCINTALQNNNLPIVMNEPTKEAEDVIVSILRDMKSFGLEYWSETGKGTVLFSTTTGVGSVEEVAPCPCFARGTLCTNCIVKKFAKNAK
jgi:hypothetical protein